jgi:hypothetical protein
VKGILPSGEGQPRRLDHMRDERRHAKHFRDGQRTLHLPFGPWEQVYGNQDTVHRRHHFGPRLRSWDARFRHEHRDIGFAQDTLGRRAEEQLANPGQAMAAHHDHVRPWIPGDLKELFRRTADSHDVLDVKCLGPISERLSHQPLQQPLRLVGTRRRSGQVDGRQQGIVNGRDDESRSKSFGQRRGAAEGATGAL